MGYENLVKDLTTFHKPCFSSEIMLFNKGLSQSTITKDIILYTTLQTENRQIPIGFFTLSSIGIKVMKVALRLSHTFWKQ